MSNVKSPITAQHEQGIHFKPLYAFDYFIGNINGYFLAIPDHFAGVGIATVCCTKDRAAARQDPAYVFDTKRDDPLFIDKSVITVTYSQNLTPVLIDGGFHCGTYDCIQPRRVTAAGEDTYLLHF